MEIYLDVVLIENFIVDLFLLSITFNVIRVEVKNKKLVLSSILGAIYTMVMIFPTLSFFSFMPIQFCVAYFMSLIIMGKERWKMAIKSTAVFLIASVTLSGICFYLAEFENSYTFCNGFSINNFSLKSLVLALMIIYIIYFRAISYFRERSVINNFTFDVEIYIDDIKYLIKGFLDTGNELREPITNLPCIIIEERLFYNYKFNEDKVYYINYSAIGYEGKLKGFKVDRVMIREEGKDFREVKAIICPCKDILSREKDFNALLSRGVV
ncbi:MULTISPECIES: sigma-E processing peptidase SpoIIGA [Clostridium]|uniref:Sporulation sigma-E factor-processing peptidase n=1 Tax=Clostridium cibarium TaxID=2762247 RepID=A0ABR8PQC6_9CLOT|nr:MULTISPECIES: sigma-E processing peptidase SpoIIGA [Clostridium]MBD7910372.1 sigma-E processing peptidase SpoIIGA [Clostridium cibarium]